MSRKTVVTSVSATSLISYHARTQDRIAFSDGRDPTAKSRRSQACAVTVHRSLEIPHPVGRFSKLDYSTAKGMLPTSEHFNRKIHLHRRQLTTLARPREPSLDVLDSPPLLDLTKLPVDTTKMPITARTDTAPAAAVPGLSTCKRVKIIVDLI